MKKTGSFILSALLMLSLLTGSASAAASDNGARSDRLSVATTIFPLYDWVMNLLGEQAGNADVTLLLDNGVDLHSYQPTMDDMVTISTCDLFIYVGGESDEWVDAVLAEAMNKDMIVVNLLEVLGDRVKEEETVEGMEADEEEADEEEIEYDEHVWLSLKNAVILCDAIADALERVDPADAGTIRANAAAYTEKLAAMDAEYRIAVDDAAVKTVLFGDRFPFRYLTDDYGLSYYAAFAGCSAETEASFATIVFLANKVDELGLGAICQIESADGGIARTIRENTRSKDQEILTFDSMQSTTAREAADGADYLKSMEQNLAVLKAALSG